MSNETGFTPGPLGWSEWVDGDGWQIDTVPTTPEQAATQDPLAIVFSSDADARLFAFAPELVEALEQFQAWAEQIQNDEDRVPLDLRLAAAALLARIKEAH